ncbi:MAG: hypothetical protein EOO25_01825 [Comamonadaceae bacterium]|nr:MAG: hypothetical protein EOO25_01825 [Comamonadaceae bacterium]
MLHTAFYKFTALPQPDEVAVVLRELVGAPDAGLTGSVLLATEGINGMLAGTPAAIDRIEQVLQHDPAFDGAFTGMVFKRSACSTPPFGKLKVYVKKEIVPLGIEGVDGRNTGIDVAPRDWRTLIKDPDVVLLDNRNSFEYRLGRFEGAIDPGVTNFRDFPAYVRAHAAEWKAQGKRVAMYCTGGILNYFQQMPDADLDWQGECFVFDNRVALDTHLQETATTLDDVYGDDDAWRLARARRLAQAARAPAGGPGNDSGTDAD